MNLKKKLREDLKGTPYIMKKEEEQTFIKSWVDFNGPNVPNILCEELAELIQVIMKTRRYNSNDVSLNLREGFADAQIMLEQAKLYYGITDEELAKIRAIKLMHAIKLIQSKIR